MERNANRTRNLILTGFFIALGLVIPYFTGHAFGIDGRVFLPMHIPVLLCGFLVGWKYGLTAGIITPILSTVLTSMPPAYPMLPIMILELATYGFLTGYFYKKKKLSIYPSLIISIIAGRIVANITSQALILGSGNQISSLQAILAGLAVSIPGTILQLALIPLLVKGVERATGNSVSKKTPLVLAKELLASKEFSCVVYNDIQILDKTDGRGVSPLIKYYDNNPELLKDNYVADKIIGKAAAMILDLAGVRYIYGDLMSKSAKEYLESRNIDHSYGRSVDIISNRDQTGICPIEKSVLETNDPQEAYGIIKNTIQQLQKGA